MATNAESVEVVPVQQVGIIGGNRDIAAIGQRFRFCAGAIVYTAAIHARIAEIEIAGSARYQGVADEIIEVVIDDARTAVVASRNAKIKTAKRKGI